jgi:DNA-binding LytR/AlgR family response regulator
MAFSISLVLPRATLNQFYRSLSNLPPVIFTTAYPDHAVDGFETNAVDYLVKPFPFDRFVRAVNKFIDFTRKSGAPCG